MRSSSPDQRRAGEAEEAGVRQRLPHVQRERRYWLRCASSVITITSSRSEQTGISSPSRRAELLDQREDVAVVLAEQLPQVRRGVGLDVRVDRASVLELARRADRRAPRGR